MRLRTDVPITEKPNGLREVWANVIQQASQAFSVAGQILRYFP